MKVFVLNRRAQPLMPCSPAKARHLLKANKATVKRRTPFTIQLSIATGETKQGVILGVDSGSKHIGLSATTEKAEVFASEVELRQDISGLLADRLALRRDRRHRKTRYRAPRFNNRVHLKVLISSRDSDFSTKCGVLGKRDLFLDDVHQVILT